MLFKVIGLVRFVSFSGFRLFLIINTEKIITGNVSLYKFMRTLWTFGLQKAGPLVIITWEKWVISPDVSIVCFFN